MPRLPHQGIAAARTPVFPLTEDFGDDLWSEFKPSLTELHAIVTDNYIDGSDPVLHVRCRDGRNWTIELASRARNVAIGLTGAAALPGDEVHVIGRRTRHFGEYRIKAVHLTIGDRAFELYPEALC